jgi:hypothetical protein
VNTYMVHMLERAREVHRNNMDLEDGTHRESAVKCPFCVADEDESWFRRTHEFRGHRNLKFLVRPPKMAAPHCDHCPLLSLFIISQQELMDDCVPLGKWALEMWEDSDEQRRY